MRQRSFVTSLAIAVAVAASSVVSGCSSTAKLAHPPRDVFGRLAASAAEDPCGSIGSPPLPTATGEIVVGRTGDDVVFYLAHPEDETLFTPGTMEALVRAKRKVFYELLSHGEGGRLIARDASGALTERLEPPEKVAAVRDQELERAMALVGIPYAHLYPASANADFPGDVVKGRGRAVHACAETLERWDHVLPDGIAGTLKLLVANIRARKPRVIVTHDPRDDDDWLDHGHHKAFGILVDLAARAAADWHVPGGAPHVVEELVTIAPLQVRADIALDVGGEMRKRLMAANASQFEAQKFFEIGQRSTERFVVRWRAAGAPVSPAGSTLASLVAIPKAR